MPDKTPRKKTRQPMEPPLDLDTPDVPDLDMVPPDVDALGETLVVETEIIGVPIRDALGNIVAYGEIEVSAELGDDEPTAEELE